ncbi:Uncharacterised protein [Chlamydia abortus]|nr:Uncharacterised protein [Chlamydia abortus]
MLQNPQRREQASPKAKYVAVFLDQQRVRLGQSASSHTVAMPVRFIVLSVKSKTEPLGKACLSQ